MVEQINQRRGARTRTRVATEHRYPLYSLGDSIMVARAIHERGGGSCRPEHLAGFLNYSTTNSGAFISRLAAARLFGLVESGRGNYVPTRLAMRLIAPEYQEDADHARVEAFLNVPLYRALYERYRNQPLPQEAGIRNILQTTYGLPQNTTAIAYRVLMESAEEAGFFRTRGSRTHLVEPLIGVHSTPMDEPDGEHVVGISVPPQGEPSIVPRAQTAPALITEQLQRVLVEKIRELPADQWDKIQQYIKEIERLGRLKEGDPTEDE